MTLAQTSQTRWLHADKRNVLLLTALHKIPKLQPGGPGYMAEMVQLGLASQQVGWQADCLGLDHHEIAAEDFVGRLSADAKQFVKQRSPRPIRSIAALLRVQSWIRRYQSIVERERARILRADLLHFLDPMAFDAVQRLGLPNRPSVFSDHSPGSFAQLLLRYVPGAKPRPAESYLLSLERAALRGCDRTILISDGQRRLKAQEVPDADFYSENVHIIHNGILDDQERRQDQAPDDAVIAFVGALTADKGVDVLSDAFARLSENGTRGRLWVIGDGPLRPVLEQRQLSGVKFLGQRNDVPTLLRQASIFVSCGRRSGFDLAILEAMRAGTCVVVSDVGGNAEAVGNAGVVLKELSPASLATALEALLQDPLARSQLGAEARRRFESEFRFDVMARRYAAVYDVACLPPASLTA